MKHLLLLATASIGLCCASFTAWAQTKSDLAKSHFRPSRKAYTSKYPVFNVTSRTSPSEFQPKTIKAWGLYNFSSTNNEIVTSSYNNKMIDTIICNVEYSDGLVTKFNVNKTFLYSLEASEQGGDTVQEIYHSRNDGSILYFYNSNALIDSIDYNSTYYYSWNDETDETEERKLRQSFDYDSNAFCTRMSEREWLDGENTSSTDLLYEYRYKEVTDSTESVTIYNDGIIKQYTVLAYNDEGAPTIVKYIYGSNYSGEFSPIYEITFTDIKWEKANNPSNILKLSLDLSPTLYENLTLQNILQNWVTSDNQLKSCNYNVVAHSYYYSDRHGSVNVSVTKNDMTIVINDDNDDNDDEITIKLDPITQDIYVNSKAEEYKYFAYPGSLPEYMVKFLTGATVELADIETPTCMIEPIIIGNRLYSEVPFNIEYDDNGILTRMIFNISDSSSAEKYTITNEFNYVIECSDYSSSTFISQKSIKPQWKITENNGSITVSGLNGKPMNVYSINGLNVYHCMSEDTVTLPVPAGVYIIKVDSTACKIVVR